MTTSHDPPWRIPRNVQFHVMPMQPIRMVKYSDLLGDGQRSNTNYYEQVRRAVGDIPLNIFSTVNNLFTLDVESPEAHRSLEAELLSDSIRNKLRRIRQNTPTKPFGAFTRAGALLNLKLLLAISRPATPYRSTAVGACALHANDFVESPNGGALASGLLPVVTEFAATWEIQTPLESSSASWARVRAQHRLG